MHHKYSIVRGDVQARGSCTITIYHHHNLFIHHRSVHSFIPITRAALGEERRAGWWQLRSHPAMSTPAANEIQPDRELARGLPPAHHSGAPATAASASKNDAATAIAALGVDALSLALGFLAWRDVLGCRVVCGRFKDAASIAPVPPTDDVRGDRVVPAPCVDSRRACDALASVARTLPNLQQICFYPIADSYLWLTSREVDSVARLRNLRSLILSHVNVRLEKGRRFPAPFEFPRLRKLRLSNVDGLTLDLGSLSGFPVLEDLYCSNIRHLRGGIECLRPLQSTLRVVAIKSCPGVNGDFMDLADFPGLETLEIKDAPVGGDVRKLKDRDFPALKHLSLPTGAYGFGIFARVADAPEVMRAFCRLGKRNGTVIDGGRRWYLSDDSVDRYGIDVFSLLVPPFEIELVRAGPRVGWRWTNGQRRGCCEINWYGDDPPEGSDDREEYLNDLKGHSIDIGLFKGFCMPPTEEEYKRLSTHW